MAMATSSPPAPMASMPMEPAAQVWLSEPRRDLPGFPKRCMCTGWLTPLPGLENQTPNRSQALRRKRWSSALRKSTCRRLWSTYWAESSVLTRSRSMASSSSMTMVPVASWVRVWSMRSPISDPGCPGSPSTRWASMSWRATLRPMVSLLHRRGSTKCLSSLPTHTAHSRLSPAIQGRSHPAHEGRRLLGPAPFQEDPHQGRAHHHPVGVGGQLPGLPGGGHAHAYEHRLVRDGLEPASHVGGAGGQAVPLPRDPHDPDPVDEASRGLADGPQPRIRGGGSG